MDNSLYSNLKCNKSYLSVDDDAKLYLDLINNFDVNIEDIYVEINFSDNCLIIKDNNLISKINDESYSLSINLLNPREHRRIEIRLNLNNIPKKYDIAINSTVFYKHKLDDSYIDGNSKTKTINLKVYYAKISEFIVNTDKNLYNKDETIKYSMFIKNTGNIKAENIIIKNFIPENIEFIKNSLVLSKGYNFFLVKNGMIINEISEDSSLNIEFLAKMLPNIERNFIKINPFLEYRYSLSGQNKESDIKVLKADVDKIYVNKGNLFDSNEYFTHRIDKEVSYLNDIINNEIIIDNKNNIYIEDAYIEISLDRGSIYVNNTITVNGIPKNNQELSNIKLDDLNSSKVIINYKTKIVDIPEDGIINFSSKIYYKTKNDESYCVNQSLKSKLTVYGPVINADFKRTQNKEVFQIGEEISFKIEIKNTGNIDIKNLILNESITDNILILKDSLFINKINYQNFKNKIYIDEIKAKDSININYKAIANKFTCNDQFTKSILFYEYKTLNEKNIEANAISNILKLKIEGADFREFSKNVDKNTYKLGDVVNIILNLSNKGNLEALDVMVKDKCNPYFSFIKNSLYINGEKFENEDIYNGIYFDIISKGETLELSYKVKVIDIPKENYIISQSCISYVNLINNKKIAQKSTIKSNEVKLYLVNPLMLIKDIESINIDNTSKKYFILNENIPFKILIKNQGNALINKLKIKTKLPKGLIYVKNSFMVNDKKINDIDFFNELTLENLESQEHLYIKFLLKQENIEFNEILKVKSYFEYSFFNTIAKESEVELEILEQDIIVINPKISAEKTIDKKIVSQGDVITEFITLANMGNAEVFNIDILIEEYDFLEPIEENNFFNNIDFKNKRIIIDNLKINEIKKVPISYRVIKIPDKTPEFLNYNVVVKYNLKELNITKDINISTNSVKFNIVTNLIELKQTCTKELLLNGDEIKYFVSVRNIGNTDYINAILNINIPKDFVYIDNTLNIDGNCNKNINSLYKIPIGDIKTNENKIISIMININDEINTDKVAINAVINGKFQLDYEDYSFEKTFKSENLNLKIEKYKVKLYRNSSLNYIQIGDKITVTSIISNEGTIKLKNVIFKEFFNPYLKIIPDSIRFNNKFVNNINLYKGIKIGDIESNENVIVDCEYECINGGCGGIIETESNIEFKKELSEDTYIIKSNKLKIERAISIFKLININGEINLKSEDPDILEVSNLIIHPKIENFYCINTIKNKSYDNQTLTGKKILIEGVITEKIEYMVKGDLGYLYFIEKVSNFSTFIVIPEDNEPDNINLIIKEEDIYFKKTTDRKIFRDINFMIEGY